MRSRFLSRECIRRPKEVPLGYDRRNTDVFQGSFVYYDGKYAPAIHQEGKPTAQTDWFVLQVPLGCKQIWCRVPAAHQEVKPQGAD